MIPGEQKQNIPLFMPNISNIAQRPINTNVVNSDATLYIGNLHPEVIDMDLFNYFRPHGDILSCRVMKDIYSGESRGFAFISFKNKEDAKNAREALNYHKIHDREVRISFKKSPSEFDPKANIFVKNISKDVSTKELEELCQQFGNVLCCAIRNDENGKSLGYGYVQYENEDAASRAVKALNDIEKWGNKLQVQFFVPSKQRLFEKKNLYIKNFPKSWDREKVENFVEKLKTKDTVISSGIYENKPDENNIRYYAFLAYDKEEDAKKVIDEYNNKKLEGHLSDDENEEEKLFVTIAIPKRVRKEQLKKKHLSFSNLTNLFIKSLKPSVTEDQLKEAFNKYGKITSVGLKEAKSSRSPDAEPLKFGFVNFLNEKEASDAFFKGKKDADIKALLHESHPNNFEFLYYAQPKALRTQYLKMKQNMMNQMMKPMPMMMQQQRRGMGHFAKGRRPHNISEMPLMPMTMLDPSNVSLIQPMENIGANNFHIQSPSNPINKPSSTSRQNERKEPQYDVTWLKHHKKEFMNFDTDKQRNILGELMFAQIQTTKLVGPENVSKVTGMLIDLEILDYEEIIDMLENSESLKERINEALEVINDTD